MPEQPEHDYLTDKPIPEVEIGKVLYVKWVSGRIEAFTQHTTDIKEPGWWHLNRAFLIPGYSLPHGVGYSLQDDPNNPNKLDLALEYRKKRVIAHVNALPSGTGIYAALELLNLLRDMEEATPQVKQCRLELLSRYETHARELLDG